MICPILKAIQVIDDVTAKMNYFLTRWGREDHTGLIDEMRQFFTETFWHFHEMDCSYDGDYALFNDTKASILRAEQSMDNIIKIWSDRQTELTLYHGLEPTFRIEYPRLTS